ncbi:ABC-2 family transporter protein [Rubripirellula lacrimiformis]|uniref:ABC-2 family transporter protein n=1 Tax=Rubripirellula lacrimiformis TaxID=1930273 RepID=A0A517NKH8_9BACT|nr:ABC transporter permease [Rubripirellula lacrimiformis]QDT07642.1 ABC-2 family transporter protein [Rubripirellula lacrimiformis]
MNLQPEDFWSFNEWLLRPNAFLESAALQGIVLFVLAIVLGLIVGYVVSAARYGPVEGFYAVARTIRDLVRFDLPGTSARRILALARLAFKEAIRRKVLFVVGLFLVVLLLAGWYLNPESDDPARLYISFVLTATNYLVLALALFISAFSLPADIKNKTIYTIVTKPVRPTEIVLGRMLGFIAMGTLVLIPMGLASFLFVTRGLRHTHQEVVDVVEMSDGALVGETDHVRNHKHGFTIEPDAGGIGLTDNVRGHQHVVTRNEDGSFSIGAPNGALRARIPSYGDIQFYDRRGEPKDEGIDVGNERLAGGYGSSGVSRLIGLSQGARKTEHGYVEGGTLGSAEYTFYNVTPDRYPDGIPIDLSVRAYRSYKGDIESGIRGSITMKHPSKSIETNPIAFVVDEYTVDEKVLDLEMEGTDNNDTRVLNVFDDLVDDEGRLTVVIRCLDRSQYLGMTRSGVYLRPAENPFWWNLIKAYISIWLQMTMVIAFGVMFSTFLSGPVAMVATFVCVLLGFSAEQVYDTRHYIDQGVSRGGGPIESLVRLLRQDAMTTELDVDTVAASVIKTVDAGIVYTLDAIATALPNLPKMVGTAEYAASGFDIFGALLLRHAAATLGYCVLAFMVSYFFLKSREIAA